MTLTSTTEEAYGAGGELLWRFTGDSNDRKFVPFEGGILAEYWSGGTLFDHPDELGSITAASDQSGNNFQERLFYPFGERWTGVDFNNFGMHQTFSKLPDYDAETDQYNTLNRHYSPSGRWLSPDPGGLKVVRLDDPQTWNMYAYVRNNPTTLSDPSGLEPAAVGDPQPPNVSDEHNPVSPTDPASTGQPQNQTTQKSQLPNAAQVVFNQVKKAFPELSLTDKNVTDLGAHNGHENIQINGKADKDQLAQVQKTLDKNAGTFGPGSRIDIKIKGKSFSLHVEFFKSSDVADSEGRRNYQFQSHIDQGNPNHVGGLFRHVFVDGAGGAGSHPNDPGLDPK